MPADTPLKRYSAMNIGSPWRGLNVVPQASISAEERSAVMFLYAMAGGPLVPIVLRMLCAAITITPRLNATPSIHPVLTGTPSIERC